MRRVPFAELSFRDVVGKTFLIEIPIREVLGPYGGENIPADADGALVHAFIGRELGYRLEVLAPARMADGHVFGDYGLDALGVTARIRPSTVEDGIEAAFPDDLARLAAGFENHVERIAVANQASDSLLSVREIRAIDPLRNPDHPDHARALLLVEGVPERVWVDLMGMTDEGLFCGELITEPDVDCGVHAGDLMSLYVDPPNNGDVMLFTAIGLRIRETDRIVGEENDPFDEKYALAKEVMRRADFLGLGNADDGKSLNWAAMAPEDEFDWEAFVTAECVPAGASQALASEIIAHVFTTSLGQDYRPSACANTARDLLETWDKAGIAAERPSGDPFADVKGCFSYWDEAKAQVDEESPAVKLPGATEKVKLGSTYHYVVRLHALAAQARRDGEKGAS